MAEFFEVMVEMRRMHNDYDDCNDGCPLHNKGFCDKPWCEVSEEDIKEAEKIIMKWSKENPVVYPTWYEYLTEIYPAAWELIACHPIPVDIAQKLEIEPVRKRK